MEREMEGLKRKGKGRERKGGSEQEREGKGGSWLRKKGMGGSELEEERELDPRYGGFFWQLAFVPNRQYPRMQRIRAGTKSTYVCVQLLPKHILHLYLYPGTRVPG